MVNFENRQFLPASRFILIFIPKTSWLIWRELTTGMTTKLKDDDDNDRELHLTEAQTRLLKSTA